MLFGPVLNRDSLEKNWVFATNPNFIIPKSQQPDDAWWVCDKDSIFSTTNPSNSSFLVPISSQPRRTFDISKYEFF